MSNPGNIFKGAAWYYRLYRRPYPAEIFSDAIDFYKLDGRGTLLDLGCGTGELAVPLAPYFEKVIGVDPSGDMLSEAKVRAREENISTIEWTQEKAENIDLSNDSLHLATAGVSFHWMNKLLVFEKIYRALETGGGMVIIGDTSPVRGKSKVRDWEMKRKELIEKYLGKEHRAGDDLHKNFISEKRPFEELIPESPFKTFELKAYEYTTQRNIDEIIGFLYSTSYANRRLFLDRADEFEKEMRSELLRLVPSNRFEEKGRAEVFFLRK